MTDIKVTVVVEIEGMPPDCTSVRKIVRRMVHERSVHDYDNFARNITGMASVDVPVMIDEGLQEFLGLRETAKITDGSNPAPAETDDVSAAAADDKQD